MKGQVCPHLKRVPFLEFASQVPEIGPSEKEKVLTDPVEISESVPGLLLIPDFLDEKAEKLLLEEVYNDKHDWFHLRDRRVKHYGFAFEYHKLVLGHQTNEIPTHCREILRKYSAQTNDDWDAEQLTVNEYPPGSGTNSTS